MALLQALTLRLVTVAILILATVALSTELKVEITYEIEAAKLLGFVAIAYRC